MNEHLLINLSLAILLLPIASFVIQIFFGKKISFLSDKFGTTVLFVCLLFSVIVLYGKLQIEEPIVTTFQWVDFGNVPLIGPLTMNLGFTIDNLSAIMLVVVTLVSALVHLFSTGYMHGDVRYSRYFAYLSIFTFSMLIIVLTSNFFLMYVGWELVGLSSYLLIGHWYEKKSASDAAKKAFVVNRIGDIGMFTGIMILYYTFHTFGFKEIFDAIGSGQIPMGSEAWLTAAGVLIFCGAIGKSAQFPLHVWLPDAMEGPTPVSALIHAATMVAAGVYLVARTFPMMTADALTVIAYVGMITAFISATIAIAQNDIKKVLAYSTVSQLGFMVVGLGVGAYTAGFFHLVTHAMFKAGLFLGSGSVIHAMHHATHHMHDHHTDPQDMRFMGGLKDKMPITFKVFLIFTAAIAGVPLFSGFLSKDMILAGTLAFGKTTGHWLIPFVMFFVAGLTAFYMMRMIFLTFFGKHQDSYRIEHIHESPKVMTIPLIVFATLSFWIFFSFNPLDGASGWLAKAVERPESVVPASAAAIGPHEFEEEMHHMHYVAMGLSLLVAAIGMYASYLTYYRKKISADAVAAKMPGLHKFLYNKWYFDELYGSVVVGGTLGITKVLNWFDKTIVDGMVNGTATWTKAVVFGYQQNWKEKPINAKVFMFGGLFVSAVVATYSFIWLMPVDAGFMNAVWSGLGALCAGLLTLFMFWGGAGGFDKFVVDGMVNGVAYLSGFLGILLRKTQTGKVQTYIMLALLGVIIIFFMMK
ncbi:MAG: NADH-quinone oxidoreductase subunit L [Ignavibacteriae bacterium]|nr:NADH-quinone oxidoreductase subunit L [Ignavibacteriota bacterium]